MAFLTVDCFSEVLHMSVNLNVILPQNINIINPVNGGQFKPPYPVLYLLHGYNGDHTVWARRTSVERYAADKSIIVIMPGAHLSFYSDMEIGFRYWTYISEELPRICKDLFPNMTDDPEMTFAAGLSMGGYGALKLALAFPERFRAAASLSGAVDVASLAERIREEAKGEPNAFGPVYGNRQIRGSRDDLFELAELAAQKGGKLPKLYQWCGKQDFLYQDNIRLRDFLREKGFDLTFEEADGDHQWKYWDAGIERVLEWIQLCLKEKP